MNIHQAGKRLPYPFSVHVPRYRVILSHCFCVCRRAAILQAESRKDCEEVRRKHTQILGSSSPRTFQHIFKEIIRLGSVKKKNWKEMNTVILQVKLDKLEYGAKVHLFQ